LGNDLYDRPVRDRAQDRRGWLFPWERATSLEVLACRPGPLVASDRAADVSPDAPCAGPLASDERAAYGIFFAPRGNHAYMRWLPRAHLDTGNTAYIDFPAEAPAPARHRPFRARKPNPEAARRNRRQPRRRPIGARTEACARLPDRADNGLGRAMAQARTVSARWRRDERERTNRCWWRSDCAAGNGRCGQRRSFPNGWPPFLTAERGHRTLALGWPYGSDGALVLVERIPAQGGSRRMDAKQDDVGLLELLDLATGQTLGTCSSISATTASASGRRCSRRDTGRQRQPQPDAGLFAGDRQADRRRFRHTARRRHRARRWCSCTNVPGQLTLYSLPASCSSSMS